LAENRRKFAPYGAALTIANNLIGFFHRFIHTHQQSAGAEEIIDVNHYSRQGNSGELVGNAKAYRNLPNTANYRSDTK
jgi:hypothetical protein